MRGFEFNIVTGRGRNQVYSDNVYRYVEVMGGGGLRLLKEKEGSTKESQTLCGQSQADPRGVCNGV